MTRFNAVFILSSLPAKGSKGVPFMRVLVACEYSAVVRDAFRARGHEAYSCDLLPTERDPSYHLQGDVLPLLTKGWDLLIAHPPCTYLSNAGVCHLYTQPNRWQDLIAAAVFFRTLLLATIPRIAIENPIMHKYAAQIIGQRQSQVIQPWMFGHLEQKATGLWLKGLPLLTPTNNVKTDMLQLPANQRQRLHYLPPSEDRWKERSRTFTGIADAMAAQWG